MAILASAYAFSNPTGKSSTLTSPDGKIQVEITCTDVLKYSIFMDGEQVLLPSEIALTLADGTVWGHGARPKKQTRRQTSETVASPFTRQSQMQDVYNALTLQFRDYSVQFRAYDNGVAYRFESNRREAFRIKEETVQFCFPQDYPVTTPYTRYGGALEAQFQTSFENTYTSTTLSGLDQTHLSFLPLVVEVGQNRKMCITESHLENYPGLYLVSQGQNSLVGVNAPRPKSVYPQAENVKVKEYEDYIAQVEGPRTYPWRIAMLSRSDTELAANNLTYLLASPCRIDDTSWIKPGKVAWEWWNATNLRGVDFRTGVNTDTYKYYIDFAANQGIEYIILDGGWYRGDLFHVNPQVDLPYLIDYGRQKNVGIILWAAYSHFYLEMEKIVAHYAQLGAKGFKIDFFDRDDQLTTDFFYRTAETCAQHHMVCDMHGAFKPAGLNRTYPNMLNFEGVYGLENMKWADAKHDQVSYEVLLPYIRQAAGPMDYTQGAMRNTTRGNYYPNNNNPMSQGTRCHQLGLYLVLESPLNMLCDSPTNYMAEAECTDFIAHIPTVWDETQVLCGEMGKYIVMARRQGNKWYIGGITNWEARDVEFSLPDGLDAGAAAVLMRDGINADRNAEDYKKETITLQKNMKIHLAPGGGFVLRNTL